MDFVQIRSQWSLNGTISYLCKLTIQEPPGTVTKNSINKKMTISQDPLVEIDPTLCQNVSYMNPLFFCSLGFQDGCCY